MTRIVDTRQVAQNTYDYNTFQTGVQSGTINTNDITNVSVFSESQNPSECTDGKDDGKLGFFETIGSCISGVFKGAVNMVKGAFTDENGNFSLLQTLKTAATIGACFIPGVGPYIGAALCAKGIADGVTTIASGISAASNATTDAEAKAAFESVGSGALTTGLSAVGMKGSIGAIKGNLNAAGVSKLSDLTKSGGEAASTVTGKLSNVANNLTGNYYQGTWSGAQSASNGLIKNTAASAKAVLKKGAEGTATNVVNAANTVKNKVNEKLGKQGNGTSAEIAEKLSTKKTKLTAEQIEKAANKGGIEVDGQTIGLEQSADGSINFKKIKSVSEIEAKVGKTTKTADASKIKNATEADLEAINKLEDGGTHTLKDGTSIKKTGDGFDVTEPTTYQKTTRNGNNKLTEEAFKKQCETLEKQGYKETTNDFGDIVYTNKAGNQTVFEKSGDGYYTSTVKNSTKTAYKAQEFKTQALKDGYQGLQTSGNVKRAGLAVASDLSGEASKDMLNNIANQSATYATVDTQTGRYYELEDYVLPS